MITFERQVIDKTVEKLIKGEDYREEVVNAINASFFDFAITFFKKIVEAKLESKEISLEWYKQNFINNNKLDPAERAIYAGMNKKTITNIYGRATKDIVLDVAKSNFAYLSNLIDELKQDSTDKIGISIKLTYRDVYVELNLAESLLVINALATKKAAIRGGAWSSIGKKVEKPLVTKLCQICGVPKDYMDDSIFKKNGELDYDREVDYKLYDMDHNYIRVEVKLMGRGNPESADVIYARDTKFFIADTLSEQNKRQFESNNIPYLEMKGNDKVIECFEKILTELNIPHNKKNLKEN